MELSCFQLTLEELMGNGKAEILAGSLLSKLFSLSDPFSSM